MKINLSILVVYLFSLAGAHASAVSGGIGFMYNADYWFSMQAPEGWVLDNGPTAQKAGVCAVFYPVGSSWADSPVVFYVNTKAKSTKVKTADDAAQNDMDDFHQNGSPHSKAEKIKDLKVKRGHVASIWEYTGDQWENYERTAFVVEEKGISCIVMTSHAKKEMTDAVPAFEKLVSSYEYIGTAKIDKGATTTGK